MSVYFAEAGILVPDEVTPPDTEPAGPDHLHEIAARVTHGAANALDVRIVLSVGW